MLRTLTKKPRKPITMNPMPVAIMYFWYSFLSGLAQRLISMRESLEDQWWHVRSTQVTSVAHDSEIPVAATLPIYDPS